METAYLIGYLFVVSCGSGAEYEFEVDSQEYAREGRRVEREARSYAKDVCGASGATVDVIVVDEDLQGSRIKSYYSEARGWTVCDAHYVAEEKHVQRETTVGTLVVWSNRTQNCRRVR